MFNGFFGSGQTVLAKEEAEMALWIVKATELTLTKTCSFNFYSLFPVAAFSDPSTFFLTQALTFAAEYMMGLSAADITRIIVLLSFLITRHCRFRSDMQLNKCWPRVSKPLSVSTTPLSLGTGSNVSASRLQTAKCLDVLSPWRRADTKSDISESGQHHSHVDEWIPVWLMWSVNTEGTADAERSRVTPSQCRVPAHYSL